MPKPDNIAPTAQPSKPRRRHVWALLSLLLVVFIPTGISAWYLWFKATDQYASTVGFSVRKEEVSSAVELLGGITDLSGSSSSDTDILYEFLQSQELVANLDQNLDLRTIWSKTKNDPIFAYDTPGTIEDLRRHWNRMVKVSYDSSSKLIEVRVLSFVPQDSQEIAGEIFSASSSMINALSSIAREDAIRYARDELKQAEGRLRTARQNITAFRNRTQIVDPAADLQGQIGLLSTLQQQLAESLIELDLLLETSRDNDPRTTQARLRIKVINERINAERQKLGFGDGTSDKSVFANLVGEYEGLAADQEFAEISYNAARATYDAAQAEARRQSRYLAAHVKPTLAEKSEFPERLPLLSLIFVFLFLAWSIAILVLYSLKDRR